MRSFASFVCVCVCVCVCVYAHVWEREKGGREGEREGHGAALCVHACERERGGGACRHVERVKAQRRVCVCERGRHGHITTAACVQTHTSFINVCHATLFPSRDWLMVKLYIFTFILKAEACDYGKGRYISDSCLLCLANHNALCQLANQSRLHLSDGGTL